VNSSAKRKPVELHVLDRKKHMGKDEIRAREESEIVMGDYKFKVPMAVKKNPAALKKWREVIKIYKSAGIKFVSSTDSGAIGRYCLLNAEYEHLIKQRAILSNLDFPDETETEFLKAAGTELHEKSARKMWRLVEYFHGLDALMKLDKVINSKARAILDVEDRIFLNPVAKVKSLPIKRREEQKDPLEAMGFDV